MNRQDKIQAKDLRKLKISYARALASGDITEAEKLAQELEEDIVYSFNPTANGVEMCATGEGVWNMSLATLRKLQSENNKNLPND